MRRSAQTTGKLGRAVVAIALTVLACFATPGLASADGVTPIARALPDTNDGFAVDGTDFYWTKQVFRRDRAKHHWIFETKLIRGSLLNNSSVTLATYNDDDDDIPETLLAGGGAVYVSFSNLDTVAGPHIDAGVKVLRISRDGSDVRTIAKVSTSSGSDFVYENRKPKLNDCGKGLDVNSVSYTGDVVIAERTSERESKHCGRKKNVDRWRYYEVTAAGLTRPITTEQSRVTSKFTFHGKKLDHASWGPVNPPVADPWVYYGRAVYQRHHNGEFYVRDLTTNVETGPFQTRIPGHEFFASAQTNSLGQMAISASSFTGDSKHEKYNSAIGVFRTPGDPASFAKMKGSASIEFCGDHLIAINNKGAREIDPATFAFKRTIAEGKDIEGDQTYIDPACTDHYLYFTRYGGTKVVQLAYPLD